MSSRFTGFPQSTLDFLDGVRRHNEKSWFDRHRDEYEANYVEAGKSSVVAAGEALRRFAPAIEAQPKVNGSIFRINRDTRFAKDKIPYKDHLDFWFWEGERKQAVSGFFLRVTPDTVGLGTGCHGFDKAALASFRSALGPEIDEIARKFDKAGYALEGEQFARVPAGLDASRPGGRFARHGALFVHVEAPATLALDGSELMSHCVKHWKALLPLHRWLTDRVQAAAG